MAYDDEDFNDDLALDEVEEGDEDGGEEGENSRKKGEENKISLAEQIILILIAAPADLFEFIAPFVVAVLVVGWATWALALLFGLIASTIIFLWSLLRGARGEMIVAKKVVVVALSVFVDAATAGILPMRTFGLIIAIWLHNHADQI